MDIKRIFVEKREEYNVESKLLEKDIREYLGIDSLEKVRVVNIYEIINESCVPMETEGANPEGIYGEITKKILADGNLDHVYEENIPLNREDKYFQVEFLPGQYNQREDSANEAIKIIFGTEDIKVKNSKLLIFSGINDEELNLIKKYYINPVESFCNSQLVNDRDCHPKVPYGHLEGKLKVPVSHEENLKVENIEAFIQMTETEIEEMKENQGLGMDIEDLLFCQKYFKEEEKRDPSITELKLIDTYWSDHCRHTTFMTELEEIQFEEGLYKPIIEKAFKEYLNSREFVYGNRDRAISLMDLATINMKEIKKKGLLEDLEESEEINACSIEIDVDVNGKMEKWLLMFKNETHNHPTEIEPHGGAATCLGGCIRDPLSGRAYVYQAMRITGASDPTENFENTLAGKLPQRTISQRAMEGYSSYGNQIGVPSGYIREIYHPNYVAKRMEVGALVAAAPRENVIRETPIPGDLVLLVGGRTGKDGLGGAVGSSKGHTEESLETGGAEVQKGNPPLERKILRLFRNENVSKMIKKCNDFGAGGVSVAIGELANGLYIDLDKVPLKYPGLDGTEIALSESQERMAVVIDEKDLNKFMEYAVEEDLETTVVAKVTDNNRLIMNWQGEKIVDISREFLDTNGIRKKSKVIVENPGTENYLGENPINIKGENIKTAWFKNMSSLNTASQRGLIEKFDHSVGKGTVLMPLGGKYQLTPAEGMAAKIPVLKGETNTCSLMTYGFDPYISKWSPFHGGMYAVIESIAKITAMGGDYRKTRLTFQEYFERLDNNYKKWGKPFAALLGAYTVNKNLNLPSIGGKDSMSGSFEDIDVPPTLISFAVNADKVENIISPEFKGINNEVVLILLDIDNQGMVDFKELDKNYTRIKELINKGKIISANSIKNGGISRAISEMSFGNKIGFKFNEAIDVEKLFLPLYGSILVEINGNVEELLKDINYEILGKTIDEKYIEILDEKIDLEELIKIWEKPLSNVFPVKEKGEIISIEEKYTRKEKYKLPSGKTPKPKIFIPIFTGTHGEYDMEKSFKKAGGVVDSFVFRTLSLKDIDYSYKEMAKRIKNCQILALPNGAVLGDEPDGGGKLLANILRNPFVEEAVMDLLNRDGLILGIGNGFQGLLKSGLLPYGKIINEDDGESINITYNTLGHHISTMAKVELISNLSPWFNNMEVGDVETLPLSTKEGRIVGDKKLLEDLIKKGQIATQFVEENPTGSSFAIESITSPDGRILGRILSCERVDKDLFKNVKASEERLFKAGVDYFK